MASRQTLAERPISFLGLVAPPPIHVQTEVFEGSLGTLFTFVRDHKVDLLDVPLMPICEAYFAYMMAANVSELDEAASALVALAFLLERKSWLLLPVPDPDPDDDYESFEITPTTHEYQAAIESLRIWHAEREQLFFRSPEAGPDPYELPYTLSAVSGDDLALALQRLLNRAKDAKVDTLSRPRRSLAEQMRLVLESVTKEWRTLDQLIPDPLSREDAVYWFLSLLELMRLGKVRAQVKESDVEFCRG